MMGMPPVYADTGTPMRLHRNGQACACAPDCTCHPPERKEPIDEVAQRGSFHLSECPAFHETWSAR